MFPPFSLLTIKILILHPLIAETHSEKGPQKKVYGALDAYPLFSLSVSEFLDVNEHGAAADLYWEL